MLARTDISFAGWSCRRARFCHAATACLLPPEDQPGEARPFLILIKSKTDGRNTSSIDIFDPKDHDWSDRIQFNDIIDPSGAGARCAAQIATRRTAYLTMLMMVRKRAATSAPSLGTAPSQVRQTRRIDDAHPQHGAKCATTMPGSALNMMDHLSVKPSRDGQCLNRLGSPCASSCL